MPQITTVANAGRRSEPSIGAVACKVPKGCSSLPVTAAKVWPTSVLPCTCSVPLKHPSPCSQRQAAMCRGTCQRCRPTPFESNHRGGMTLTNAIFCHATRHTTLFSDKGRKAERCTLAPAKLYTALLYKAKYAEDIASTRRSSRWAHCPAKTSQAVETRKDLHGRR
jgi:hypothetical protein